MSDTIDVHVEDGSLQVLILGRPRTGKTSLALVIETALCQLGLGKNVIYEADEPPERQDELEDHAPESLANVPIRITEIELRPPQTAPC